MKTDLLLTVILSVILSTLGIIILVFSLNVYWYYSKYINKTITGDLTAIESVYKLRRDAWTSPNPSTRYVVSFTSIPERFNKIGPTLASLLDARVPFFDEIVINIPVGGYTALSGKYFPEFETIKYIEENLSVVKIRRIETDYGPASKLIPTVIAETEDGRLDTRIIVVDDDQIYFPDSLTTLVNEFDRRSGEVAITNFSQSYGCWLNLRNFHMELAHGKISNKLVLLKTHTNLVFGSGGYCVTPSMFDERLYDYSDAPFRIAYVNDDYWISAWLAIANIKVMTTTESMGVCDLRPGSLVVTNSRVYLNSAIHRNKLNSPVSMKVLINWFRLTYPEELKCFLA